MPREIRKRGKKKKTQAEEQVDYQNQKREDTAVVFQEAEPEQDVEPTAGPSWMRSAPAQAGPSGVDSEAPFGYVEADVKAYFRTVDLKLREWQEGRDEDDVPEGVDPNEERRAFVMAALTEMTGKELQLATDPDCSTILERLARSMDDFSRRVFMDKLAGSYPTLAKHRFGSHVCQTYFNLAQNAVSSEASPSKTTDADGLRTMTALISDAAEEILEPLTALIMDPFASHVIRALVLTLSPDTTATSSSSSRDAAGPSKKSAAFKAKQGSMKSVFDDQNSTVKSSKKRTAQPELVKLAGRYVAKLRADLDDNSIRALASDKVANPVLQIMVRIEAENNESAAPGSLMDRILMGLVTQLDQSPSIPLPRSDYIETLLRDPTSSHLVEALLLHAPQRIFAAIWATYVQGRVAKLATHPVSNYVVAKGIERLDGEGLAEVVKEMGSAFGRTIKLGRTGVHRALIERAAATQTCETEVVEALADGFGFKEGEDRTLFVPCVLNLQTLDDYREAKPPQADQSNSTTGGERRWGGGVASGGKQKQKPAFSTQGAILLQSLLRLHERYNGIVIDSLLAQPIESLLSIACDPAASRVLDVILEPPNPSTTTTIPIKARRKLILAFLEHFPTLVDDKLGSRVADRCWAAADPYLKERIARSLIPHERFLAQSFYGKFFARNLHLTLLRRNPEQWKAVQIEGAAKAKASAPGAGPSTTKPVPASDAMDVDVKPAGEAEGETTHRHKKDKKKRSADAIDDIFGSSGKKRRRDEDVAMPSVVSKAIPAAVDIQNPPVAEKEKDKDLKDILGAIKDVPKGQALREGGRHHKKGKK